MSLLTLEQWEVKDEVQTEETVRRQLEKDVDFLSEYDFASYNFADSINKKGIVYTQSIVNNFIKMSNRRLVFVCQHISVDKISWGKSSIVFTPHATLSNKFRAIPHFSNALGDRRDIKEKTLLSSFMGSYDTHHTRRLLSASYKRPRFHSVDTGAWHFMNVNKSSNDQAFRELLSRSKTSACPRGTGPSTIRLWEAMGTGSIPLLISDDLVLPEIDGLDWRDIIVRVPQSMASITHAFVEKLDSRSIESMTRACSLAYDEYFSNERLSRSIVESLKR